jgi:GntR family transcriptional regulator
MINFRLDKKSPVPFYRQIIDMVLAGISAGSILPGEKLPTIREAAVNLEVNPNTIAKAYSQLRLMGVLDSQQGSGVFVRPQPSSQISEDEKRKILEALCSDFISRAQILNIDIEELIKYMSQIRGRVNRNNTKNQTSKGDTENGYNGTIK